MENNMEKSISIIDPLCCHTENVCLVARSRPTFFWPIALLSMGLSRQEYWSGLPSPSPRNLPDPASEFRSPVAADGFFTIWGTREVTVNKLYCKWIKRKKKKNNKTYQLNLIIISKAVQSYIFRRKKKKLLVTTTKKCWGRKKISLNWLHFL